MIMLGLTSTGQRLDHTAPLEEWITRIAAGEKDAVAGLYRETREAVFGFSLSIVKNPHNAEEIMQETYLKIWSSAAAYRPQGKPMAWILTIAKNLALSRFREQKRMASLTEEQWRSVPDSGALFSSEDRMVLETALRVLSDQERQILLLHALSGLKHREIADLLELPLPTVLSKYHRSRKKLLLMMKEDQCEEN